MKEIPSSVISVANNDIESSMKESSTKKAFISAHTKHAVPDVSGCVLSHFSANTDTTLCIMPNSLV